MAKSSWISVDTEGDSLHHYFEKLCLVQLSTASEDYIIDPLVVRIDALVKILESKSLILHGADFDIRILKKTSSFIPKQIFDTMIAAQLLGYPKQGLADLTEKHCGVRLSKSAQTADWSKRPLETKLLEYAVSDTKFLKAIEEKMREELVQLGRLDWHTETCQQLLKHLNKETEEKKEKIRPWQIKGSKELGGRALTILKELWLWREEEAKKLDRPAFKILNNESMIGIADWASKKPGVSVEEMGNAPRHIRGQYRMFVDACIQKGFVELEERFTVDKSSKRPPAWSDKDLRAFEAIKAAVEKMAAELKINVSLLATNAQMRQIVHTKPLAEEEFIQKELLMRWQAKLLSPSILKILAV